MKSQHQFGAFKCNTYFRISSESHVQVYGCVNQYKLHVYVYAHVCMLMWSVTCTFTSLANRTYKWTYVYIHTNHMFVCMHTYVCWCKFQYVLSCLWWIASTSRCMCRYTQSTCLCACTFMHVDVKFNMYFHVSGQSHIQVSVCVNTYKSHICVCTHACMLIYCRSCTYRHIRTNEYIYRHNE